MSIFSRWFRRGGKEPDPTIGLQIGLLAGAVGANEARENDNDSAADYGWSGDHMSGGGSDSGGGGDFGGGGGFDGGDGGGGGY